MRSSLLKRVLFRLHWIAGISAGLVLGVVGFTGGLLGLVQPVLAWLTPGVQVSAEGRELQSPDRWVAAARAAMPGHTVRAITWEGPDHAVGMRLARAGARPTEVALDPYSGAVLGAERGHAFFATAEQIHRNLAAGPVGKQIVGASTALMFVFLSTGIYLRWPRRARSPSAWLRMNTAAKGRGFWWQLHAVVGTWLLIPYLLAAATGLWWSYDFYRNAVNGLAGVPAPQRRAPASDAPQVASLDPAWSAFLREVPDATRANIAATTSADGALEIRYQTAASPHDRAWDSLKLDPAAGVVRSREAYADLPRGRRFVSSLFPLHSGSWFGVPGRVIAAGAALLMPLFALSGLWMWVLRRRNEALRREAAIAQPSLDAGTA
ncbi:MAG: PepSY-associated TM helix domain-containing protein [Dokdonella sp.]|uniref:PepSY-associated TM helix domain-containing protein n=1 Tax=Dokdonella sp. TaxID=2291710 RepID=UPI003F7EF93E